MQAAFSNPEKLRNLCGLFSFLRFSTSNSQWPAFDLIRNAAEQRTARIRLKYNVAHLVTFQLAEILSSREGWTGGLLHYPHFWIYHALHPKRLAVCLNSSLISDIELTFFYLYFKSYRWELVLALSVILGLSTKLWLSTVVQSKHFLCLKVTLEAGNFTVSCISENVGWLMPDYTFPKINIWCVVNTQTLDVGYSCKTPRNVKKLHIVVKFWPLKATTTTYCAIRNSEDGSCLCLKVPRASARGRLLPWVEKSDGNTAWFYSNIDKNRAKIRLMWHQA